MESLIIESLDPEGPYGAKEAGEGPLHPSIPAIANAIYDAVGVRMDAMPFSPPNVWRALQAAGAREAWERGHRGRSKRVTDGTDENENANDDDYGTARS